MGKNLDKIKELAKGKSNWEYKARLRSCSENMDLLRVMYERLTQRDLRAKYVVAMMHTYSRVYSQTLVQLSEMQHLK